MMPWGNQASAWDRAPRHTSTHSSQHQPPQQHNIAPGWIGYGDMQRQLPWRTFPDASPQDPALVQQQQTAALRGDSDAVWKPVRGGFQHIHSGWVCYDAWHPKYQPEPRADHGYPAGKDTVHLNTTVDSARVREVPLIADYVFARGLEWYKYYHNGDEPPFHERPSIQQFTAMLELIRCRCGYVDLGLLAPHDIRTARGNRWKDYVEKDGKRVYVEIKGPPDCQSWLKCWKIKQTGWSMANVVTPPRMGVYSNMIVEFNDKFPDCFSLLYQQDDRCRHELIPELLRTETELLEKRMAAGWFPGLTPEKSVLNPDYPWDHIYHLLVKGQESKDWWRDTFVHHATEVRHKIITVASTLDGDAPVAHSIAEHPSVVMHVPTAVQVTHGSMSGLPSRPPQQSAAKRRKIDAHHGSPPDIRGNPRNQGGNQATIGAPRVYAAKKEGGFEICQLYNRGKCNGAARAGACGPHTCANADRIHACNICGTAGHPSSDCSQRAPGTGKKHAQRTAAPQGAKGRSSKGKSRGRGRGG